MKLFLKVSITFFKFSFWFVELKSFGEKLKTKKLGKDILLSFQGVKLTLKIESLFTS